MSENNVTGIIGAEVTTTGIIGATVAIGQYIVNDYVITIAPVEDDYGYTMTITRGSDTQTVTLYGLSTEQYNSMLGYLQQAQEAAQNAAGSASDAYAYLELALDAANRANTQAARAEQASDTARSYASQAQTAKQGAETAKTDAQTARTQAQGYWQAAETAATRAGSAATRAETALAAAETAQSAAEAAQTAAEAAETDTQTYAGQASQSAANAAQSAASAAQTLAQVQAEGAAQIAAIDAEGQRVIDSIPEDYTEVVSDVADLKSQTESTVVELLRQPFPQTWYQKRVKTTNSGKTYSGLEDQSNIKKHLANISAMPDQNVMVNSGDIVYLHIADGLTVSYWLFYLENDTYKSTALYSATTDTVFTVEQDTYFVMDVSKTDSSIITDITAEYIDVKIIKKSYFDEIFKPQVIRASEPLIDQKIAIATYDPNKIALKNLIKYDNDDSENRLNATRILYGKNMEIVDGWLKTEGSENSNKAHVAIYYRDYYDSTLAAGTYLITADVKVDCGTNALDSITFNGLHVEWAKLYVPSTKKIIGGTAYKTFVLYTVNSGQTFQQLKYDVQFKSVCNGSEKSYIRHVNMIDVTNLNLTKEDAQLYANAIMGQYGFIAGEQTIDLTEAKQNPLKNHTIALYGDSIFGITTVAERLETVTGANVYNCAVGGETAIYGTTPIGWSSSSPWSLYKISQAIKTGDWTDQIADNYDRYTRVSAPDLALVDAIVICIGTNDFVRSPVIGQNDSTDPSEWKGALNDIINNFRESCQMSDIYFVTPMYRMHYAREENEQNSDIDPNAGGVYLSEFVDAEIDILNSHHVPFVNLLDICNFDANNYWIYLPDGTHPGNYMSSRIARLIKEIINQSNPGW